MVQVLFVVSALQLAGAWSGARPRECLPAVSSAAHEVNVWERAKAPELRRYCDLLASGASKMASSVSLSAEVLAIADEAERLRPRRAATRVLRGRALAQLGRDDEARAAFLEAQATDPAALDEPSGLLAWARVLARTGRETEAREAYRALLPRAAALPSPERGAAALEAALLAMARGRGSIEDAVALFRQARRDAQDAMSTTAALGLALALDRAGERDEARAVLAEIPRAAVGPALVAATPRLFIGSLAPEGLAFAAMAQVRVEPAAAARAFRAYLDGGGARSPWAEHARARSESRGEVRPEARPRVAGQGAR